MSVKKVGVGIASVAAAGVLVLGGNALADAATGTSGTSGTSGTGSTAPGYGNDTQGGRGGDGGRGAGGGSSDTPVTGDEATKVIAAVKAKDSSATVTSVRKDPDGSYDALGTKGGTPVMYDVSADLKTITEHTGGGQGGGHDGQRGQGGPSRGGPSASSPSGAATSGSST